MIGEFHERQSNLELCPAGALSNLHNVVNCGLDVLLHSRIRWGMLVLFRGPRIIAKS